MRDVFIKGAARTPMGDSKAILLMSMRQRLAASRLRRRWRAQALKALMKC